eukprot:11176169-Lingulodinium_polyedra.AAC.1
MELVDICDDRAWLSTEPTASDLSGLCLRSLRLWSSDESVKTADLVRKIIHARAAATSKHMLCHGFTSPTS